MLRTPTPTHGDPGLQPERTSLAWARSMTSLVVAAAIFLRWLPHYGWFVGVLVTASVFTAAGIAVTRRRRYRRAVQGLAGRSPTADAASVAVLAASVAGLCGVGIYTVLFLP